jgi:hypothetical protein
MPCGAAARDWPKFVVSARRVPLLAILPRAMIRGALTAAAALALSLSACSGQTATGLDQMVYNATYSGQAVLQRSPVEGGVLRQPPPMTLTMTLAQLGQDFTGTFVVADSSGQTFYYGSVAGRTTSGGADFTFVVPPVCPGALYGSWTVSGGALSGAAAGRDCGASAADNNVHITFTNLVRH